MDIPETYLKVSNSFISFSYVEASSPTLVINCFNLDAKSTFSGLIFWSKLIIGSLGTASIVSSYLFQIYLEQKNDWISFSNCLTQVRDTNAHTMVLYIG